MKVAVKILLVAVVLSLGVVFVGLRSGGTLTQTADTATGRTGSSTETKIPVTQRPTAQTDPSTLSQNRAATFTLGLSRVHINKSLPHPSCISEEVLRTRISDADTSGFIKRYGRPGENCFKNCGGALVPGEPRMLAPFLTVTNAVFSQGNLHLITSKREKPRRLAFAAYFPMISGVWPQPIVSDVSARSLTEADAALLVRGNRGPTTVIDVGYFQPPTDFLSTYHTVVETVLPAFHRLLDRIAPDICDAYRGRPAHPTFVLTSRPTTSKYGFKPKTCHIAPDEALLAASAPPKGRHEPPICLSTVWGKMFTAMIGGPERIYGLRPGDAQMFDEKLMVKLKSDEVFVFNELRLGNPTTCEPLWGPDPFYAESLAHQQELNVTAIVKRLSRDAQLWHDRFSASFSHCQDVMWRFRSFFIGAAAQERALSAGIPQLTADDEALRVSAEFSTPITATQGANDASEPRVVLWATRKGDWARWITNEDEILAALKRHLETRHPRLVLRVVRFGGTLWNQVQPLKNVSIFIANHGANILPSVYLRPNAGVITLSFAEPGFYPFAVFPSWLHWRNILIEQDCNRRLFKGKCKWSTPNNNDMRMTSQQIAQLLDAVDSIFEAARDASTARRPLHDPTAQCQHKRS